MVQLKIEGCFRIPNRRYVVGVRGDCSKIRIGSVLVFPDGREVMVNSIGTMCGVFREDYLDLLIRDEFDAKSTVVYLKE